MFIARIVLEIIWCRFLLWWIKFPNTYHALTREFSIFLDAKRIFYVCLIQMQEIHVWMTVCIKASFRITIVVCILSALSYFCENNKEFLEHLILFKETAHKKTTLLSMDLKRGKTPISNQLLSRDIIPCPLKNEIHYQIILFQTVVSIINITISPKTFNCCITESM